MSTMKTIDSVENTEFDEIMRRIKEEKTRELPKIERSITNPGDPRNEKFKQSIENEFNLKIENPRPIQDTAKDIAKLAEASKVSEEKKLEETLQEEADLWVADDMGNLVKNILANKKRLKAIESRCPKMNIDDYFVYGHIEQEVPIVPGKFVPTFRTLGGDVDLFIKNLLAKELAYKNQMSDRYIMDKWGLMQVCASLVALNGKEEMSFRDPATERLSEDLFWKKFDRFIKRPFELLADLLVQYSRFSERARLVLNVDNMMDF